MSVNTLCVFQRLCPRDTVLVRAPRGRTILMRDQDVAFLYHLHEGVAAGVRAMENGREIAGLIVPPAFLGLGGFADMYSPKHRKHLADIRAVTPTVYCKVRREVVWELMDDRSARSEILNIIYATYLAMFVLVGSRLRNDVPTRIISMLQLIARTVGKSPDSEGALIHGLSQEELAFLSNTTRSSVTRVLKLLETAGLIQITRRHIVIPHLQKLLDIASLDTVIQ
jgi:CRP-like cAMP-binding protein